MNINKLMCRFKTCTCGRQHHLSSCEVIVESGISTKIGEILVDLKVGKNLFLVADESTLKASVGLEQSLKNFKVEKLIYKDKRTAEITDVNEIIEQSKSSDAILAVGTGSIHDICRLSAARADKTLILFATAGSMDGFASYSSPITTGNFKASLAAKMPEIIIADTKILAAAPNELKAAGFGDMMGKYVGLIDWQISNLVSGEYYCERVASLTRSATDAIYELSGSVLSKDEECAKKLFEMLLLTGIGMALVQNSRPASGTEHIVSHYWECQKLLKGEQSDFHGKKVAVATLLILKEYEKLAKIKKVKAVDENVDWQQILNAYGELADDVKKINFPNTITDKVDKKALENNWQDIVNIVNSVPSYDEIYCALKKAGCATDISEIAISENLKDEALKYHMYMRDRLSLMRLKNMIEIVE